MYTFYIHSFFWRARTNISKLNPTNASCQFSDIWLYLCTQNEVVIKSTDSGVSISGILTPAIPLSSCINLSMLFKLSVPQFLHLEKWKFYLTHRFVWAKWVKPGVVLNTEHGTHVVLGKLSCFHSYSYDVNQDNFLRLGALSLTSSRIWYSQG